MTLRTLLGGITPSCMICVGIIISSLPLSANVTYSYTGTTFTQCVGTYSPCVDKVTGSFTVASALISRAYDVLTPISASFSDGRQTKTLADQPYFFNIGTNQFGAITDWAIAWYPAGGGSFNVFTQGSTTDFQQPLDQGAIDSANYGISRISGSWTMSSDTVVPEPQYLACLFIGLSMLVGAKRYQVKRRATPTE